MKRLDKLALFGYLSTIQHTSNVESMAAMFRGCESLASLDLKNFETGKVTDMNSMFSGCEKITTLNVSNFDTSKVERMSCMFQSCDSLTSLDVSSFNTNNVIDMSNMFWNCENLISLDLSNFNAINATDMSYMLGCKNLTTLYTPYNVKESVALPVIDSTEKWTRPDGTVVTELPKNTTSSIKLTKNKASTGDLSADDEMKYVQKLTQNSLKNADEESKEAIENAIFNLLFKAEYRPINSLIPNDAYCDLQRPILRSKTAAMRS